MKRHYSRTIKDTLHFSHRPNMVSENLDTLPVGLILKKSSIPDAGTG